jgi:hypothetical protein
MAHPIVRAAVQIASGAFLLLIAFFAYATYAERRAEQNARDFCSAVKIGEKPDGLLETAKSSGADQRRTRWLQASSDEKRLTVTFTGFTPISRHICSVSVSEHVTSAQYIHID